jgi:hypothetical protein
VSSFSFPFLHVFAAGVIYHLYIANFAVVAGSYAFAYLTNDEDSSDDDDAKKPEWLKFVYKSLDFGSGKERGARQ